MKIIILLICLLLSFAVSANAQMQYEIIDLGTLGGNFSSAYDINNVGEVVGASRSTIYVPDKAFLYSGGVMNALSNSESTAYGINDTGQAVGYFYTPYDEYGHSYQHAFIYSDGVITDLGTLNGGFISEAQGINNSGQIVGSSGAGVGIEHAFLYSGGVMNDLGSLGGSSWATDINDIGQVVGYSDNVLGNRNAFIYSDGVMTDLGTLSGGIGSFAHGINNSSDVVGEAAYSGGLRRAFLYSSGVMTDIGTLGGSGAYAFDINDFGQVVGRSYILNEMGIDEARAFLYTGGVMTDLNDLLPVNSGWYLAAANAINNSGQIVGYGLYNTTSGNYLDAHAFLMSPTVIPEPLSSTLFIIGGATLGIRRFIKRTRT